MLQVTLSQVSQDGYRIEIGRVQDIYRLKSVFRSPQTLKITEATGCNRETLHDSQEVLQDRRDKASWKHRLKIGFKQVFDNFEATARPPPKRLKSTPQETGKNWTACAQIRCFNSNCSKIQIRRVLAVTHVGTDISVLEK